METRCRDSDYDVRQHSEMTSRARAGGLEGSNLSLLRRAALIAVITGAVGSLGLMLHAGRRQKSLILIGLFTVWELSPFVALVCAHVVSRDSVGPYPGDTL